MIVINGILGGLVRRRGCGVSSHQASIMAGCGNVTCLESVIIGAVGALLVTLAGRLLVLLRWRGPQLVEPPPQD
jgi:hypothetical protein